MRKEFMLYIRNAGDAKASLSPERHLAFIKQCESYIGRLKANGNLIAAQPIVREGLLLSKGQKDWTLTPLEQTNFVYPKG